MVEHAAPQAAKVALVANTGWNIVRFRSLLIEALVQRGIEVVAIADFDASQEQSVAQMGATPMRLPLASAGRNPLKDLQYLGRLTGILRGVRPELVHLFTIKPVIYGALAARLAGVPAIVAAITGRGILSSGRPAWLRPLLRHLMRRALAGRNQQIFQNREDLEWFVAQGFATPAQARYIPGSGVDTRALRPAEDLPPAARRSFVMASRMLWSKGVADFVAAAREVRSSHPDAAFLLFGGGREDYGSQNPDFIARDWLEALNEEGVVTWHGLTDPAAVEAAMRAAAAVVLPSYYAEGVPRTLIEAAAAGAPIITTDMPGCRDTVDADRSGFLVPSKAPAQIAAAMRALLDEPQRIAAMGAASRALAVATFDSERIIAQTLEVYGACLAQAPARAAGALRRA